MGLGILFWVNVIIAVLVVAGILGIFIVKEPKKNRIIFLLLTLFTIGISALSAMSQPSNYALQQAFAWLWAALAAGGAGMSLLIKRYSTAGKYLVALSALGATACLLIM